MDFAMILSGFTARRSIVIRIDPPLKTEKNQIFIMGFLSYYYI